MTGFLRHITVNHALQLPQRPLIVMKRGAELPRLLMEVVGITL